MVASVYYKSHNVQVQTFRVTPFSVQIAGIKSSQHIEDMTSLSGFKRTINFNDHLTNNSQAPETNYMFNHLEK